jgi:hypothetical protein
MCQNSDNWKDRMGPSFRWGDIAVCRSALP